MKELNQKIWRSCLGRALRRHREEAGASRLGIEIRDIAHQNTIARIESGKGDVYLGTLMDLCVAYGCFLSDVIYMAEDMYAREMRAEGDK